MHTIEKKELLVTVNRNLKNIRVKAGLTQIQFAEKLGLTKPQLGSYEELRAMPPLNVLCKVKELYSVSLDDLVK